MSSLRKISERNNELISEFGIKVTVSKLFVTILRRVPFINYYAEELKYNAITGYLYKENKKLIDDFQLNKNNNQSSNEIGENSKIWILWWQGECNAPDIVKICLNSIQKYSYPYEVVVLDSNNYSNYVTLNQNYPKLLYEKKISQAQFSDILRLNLLYQQGGIWLDATYLLTGPLPDFISKLPFFTIRHGMYKEFPMSKGLWTGSAIACEKGNNSFKLFIEIFDNYYKYHEHLIDYFLIDYIFATCCDHVPSVKAMFESVPVNNIRVNELMFIMNKKYDTELMCNTLKGTNMNKLSWKKDYKKVLESDCTAYGHFYAEYLK